MRCTIAALTAAAVLSLAPCAAAGVVYSTGFDDYLNGNLSGQSAWVGPTGSWATSGSMNSGQTACTVLASDGGILPVGGTGKMVRITTERFLGSGRSKGWLDFLNSGKWATASAGGNTVLRTTVSMYIPAGNLLGSSFGVIVYRDAATAAGGFLVNAQTGLVSIANGGYDLASRTATATSVALGQWNTFTLDWNSATGAATLSVNGSTAGSFTSVATGSVYSAQLFSTTDAPGAGTTPLNAYAYFDNFSAEGVAPAPACPADVTGDGVVDGADLGRLLGTWGRATIGTPSDLNHDGIVDGADLGIMLGAWGPCV